MKDNYYQILGLGPKASQEEIKAAYKRLAREHHPDVNHGSKESEEAFKKVLEAYQTLSDPRKKDLYDVKLFYKTVTQSFGNQPDPSYQGVPKTRRQKEDENYRRRRPEREAYREHTGPPKREKVSPHSVALTLFVLGTVVMLFLWLGDIMNHLTAKEHLERGDFGTALLFDEEYGEAYYARFLARKSRKANPKILLFDLNMAIKYMDEPHVQPYLERGKVYFSLDSVEKSVADFDYAKSINPACDTAYLALAEIFGYYKNQPSKALVLFDSTLKYNPNSFGASFGRADMLYRLKRFSSAIQAFDECQKIDRSDNRIFFYRGSARLAMGDSAGACFDLDQALNMGAEEAKPLVDRFCHKFGF